MQTVQIQRGQSDEEIAKKVKEVAGMTVKVALECTGVESSIRAAIYVGTTCILQISAEGQVVCQIRGYGLRHRCRTFRDQGVPTSSCQLRSG